MHIKRVIIGVTRALIGLPGDCAEGSNLIMLDLGDSLLLQRIEALEGREEMRDRQFAATQQHLLKASEALLSAAREIPGAQRALTQAAEALKRAAETTMKPKGRLPK